MVFEVLLDESISNTPIEMKIKSLLQNLKSDQLSVKQPAIAFLHRRFRGVVSGSLKNYACTDQEVVSSIFHDALIDFIELVEDEQFEKESASAIGAYLKQSSFFYWSKHPDNPKREQMKRGKQVRTHLTELAVEDSPVIQGVVPLSNLHESKEQLLHVSSEEHSSFEKEFARWELTEKVKDLIRSMSSDCRERLSRSDFFQPVYTLWEKKGKSMRIKSEETGEDLQDSSATQARKKLQSCTERLKKIIVQALKTDKQLVVLLDTVI